MLTYPFGKACKEIFGKPGEPVYRMGQVYRVRQSQVTGSEQEGGLRSLSATISAMTTPRSWRLST